jgi:hypothetical protein
LSISVLTFIKWRLTPSSAAKDTIFWQKTPKTIVIRIIVWMTIFKSIHMAFYVNTPYIYPAFVPFGRYFTSIPLYLWIRQSPLSSTSWQFLFCPRTPCCLLFYHILPVVITYQYLLMNALLAMKLTPNMGVIFFKYIKQIPHCRDNSKIQISKS